jgi:hypothetical protein
MPKDESRSFSREFKLGVIERLEAGESGSALALALKKAHTPLLTSSASAKSGVCPYFRGGWLAALGPRFLHPPNVSMNAVVHNDPTGVDHADKSYDGERAEHSDTAQLT